LELIALHGSVLGQFLGAAELAVFFGSLRALHLGCLHDRAGEWVDLRHGSAIN
jgi:hypothetical protein